MSKALTMHSMNDGKTAQGRSPDVRTIFSFRLKEPGSAVTHFIGYVAAIVLTPVLLIHKAAQGADMAAMVGCAVFMMSMILLYGASSSYHSFDVSPRVNRILKKIDHMSISVLIAGSYTPICLSTIGGTAGHRLLAVIWGLAALSMVFKALWVNCPKWISSILYIGMGWTCIFFLPAILQNMAEGGFLWLLAGGLLYTAGGVIYAFRFDVFRGRFRYFGTHELFHLFILAGSLCHYICIFRYLV